MTKLPTSGTSDVQVWSTRLDRDIEARLPAALALLDASEAARADRFLVPRPRVEYILSHAMVRTALAACTGVDPRDFAFRERQFGKPEIAAPVEHAGLRFNLSHTRGLAACAIAVGREVGIDVEHEDRQLSLLDVARTVFSPGEMDGLERAPDSDRRDIFYALWTLKEAFMKATGEGFHLAPKRLHIELGADERTVTRALLDGASLLQEWCVFRFRPSPEHAGALVVRSEGGAHPDILWHEEHRIGEAPGGVGAAGG